MNAATLIRRSLRFHWRAHLGVFLGALVATAILVGALAVGDSVRYSLRSIALARLGDVRLAMHGQARFFLADLAEKLQGDLAAPVAPVLSTRGSAIVGGGEKRVGRVQVLGVDDRFWALGGASPQLDASATDAVVINRRLADRLGATVGEDLLLRVEKPSLLSRDAPMASVDDASVAIRVAITGIADEREFGRFSLEANQIAPYSAFLPLPVLQRALDLGGRANTLLVGAGEGAAPTAAAATSDLWKHWRLADASLELRELPHVNALELRSERIFLDAPIAEAAIASVPGARGVLTYFVNELRAGGRATPYSTVAAIDGDVEGVELADDEVAINQWLARDLGAKVGDELTLRYYVEGPMRNLTEDETTLRIAVVLPMTGLGADPSLMPEFPGLHDSANCRDWTPGVPVNLDRIRDQDEAYWDLYRGAPKALVNLEAGRRMWGNRFGNLTAVRYPDGQMPADAVDACIRQALNPTSVGLFFAPVREQALAAVSQAQNFGGLFLGFSFFLIFAALLLTALLFALGVEQRAEEVGTLLAVGFRPRQVQALLAAEGGALSLVAGVLGALLGVFYTQAVIRGLSTVWSGAVADSPLLYHAEPATLAFGAGGGFLVALLSIWLAARQQAKAPARELLAGGDVEQRLSHFVTEGPGLLPPGARTTIICLAGAGVALVIGGRGEPTQAAGAFFGAGALLLIGGIAACRLVLARLNRQQDTMALTVGALGVRNSVRRWGRSLTAIALLACGAFLVIAVGANRHDPSAHADERHSGTGGFALYAESTLPIYHDLTSEAGMGEYGLYPDELEGARILPMRRREGDEASCLNLNRAQSPRLLGVDPDTLDDLDAFRFAKTLAPVRRGTAWRLLERRDADGAIPAIGDTNTVTWSLGKKLGDTLDYVDERGQSFQLKIVGVMANSILQGSLVISEAEFIRRFPTAGGYQVFLIDGPRAIEVGETLSNVLEDIGFEATPTPDRLAEFSEVENTYLSIFAVLGGLGLLLGSVGLGVVVLRNVLERRGELALLRAVGFRRRSLHWLIFSEHSLLLTLGLAVGIVAAGVAILPVLGSPGAGVPYASLGVTLAAVFIAGFVWVWGATRLALRGQLLEALRNE